MSTRNTKIAVTALCLALAGCGGKGPDDPLTGTWSNTLCFGDTQLPADIQTCSTALRFDSDLTLTVTDTRQSLPATAVFPRCTAIRAVTGLKYSTDGKGTVTFTGTTSSTLERKDCATTTDNQGPMADTRDSVPAGTSKYSITDKKLSITSGPLVGEYQRQ